MKWQIGQVSVVTESSLKINEHETAHLFYLNTFFFFVSNEVGQMENVSPGQIIDEPTNQSTFPGRKDFQGMLEYKRG